MAPEILVGIGTIVISVLTVVAIVVAPIVADVQRKAGEARGWKNRKLWFFETLMSNRSTRLNPAFVQALSMIDIEFTAASEKRIQDAWKKLLDHYNDRAGRRRSRERLMRTGTLKQRPTCLPNYL